MEYTTKIIEVNGLPAFIIPDEIVKKLDIHIGDEYDISADKESRTIFVQLK